MAPKSARGASGKRASQRARGSGRVTRSAAAASSTNDQPELPRSENSSQKTQPESKNDPPDTSGSKSQETANIDNGKEIESSEKTGVENMDPETNVTSAEGEIVRDNTITKEQDPTKTGEQTSKLIGKESQSQGNGDEMDTGHNQDMSGTHRAYATKAPLVDIPDDSKSEEASSSVSEDAKAAPTGESDDEDEEDAAKTVTDKDAGNSGSHRTHSTKRPRVDATDDSESEEESSAKKPKNDEPAQKSDSEDEDEEETAKTVSKAGSKKRVRISRAEKQTDDYSQDVQKVRDTIRKNPPEVKLLDGQNLEQCGPALPGYLELAGTGALRAYFLVNDTPDPAHSSPLALQDRCAGNMFRAWRKGVSEVDQVEKHWSQFCQVKPLFNLLQKAWVKPTEEKYCKQPALTREELRFIKRPDFTDDLEDIIPQKVQSRSMRKVQVLFIAAMNWLLKRHSELFPDPPRKNNLLDVSSEDWHRAYKMLIAYRKTGHKWAVPDPSKKPQDRKAVTPLFLTKARITAAQSKVTEESHEANENKRLVELFEDYRKKFVKGVQAENSDIISYMRSEKALEVTGQDVPTGGTKSVERPRLTDSQRDLLCKSLFRKTNILYPDDFKLDINYLEGRVKYMTPPEEDEHGKAEFVQQQTLEAGMLESDSLPQSVEDGFHRLRRIGNLSSAAAPSLKVAAKKMLSRKWEYGDELELIVTSEQQSESDDAASTEQRFKFYPWQVTAAAWLRMMRESGLGFAILGEDMGLGKTLTSLLFAYNDGRRQVREARKNGWTPGGAEAYGIEALRRGPFRPYLAVAPQAAAASWKNDLAKFGILIKTVWMKSDDPETIKDIIADMKKLDANDPTTTRVVYLTTYGTLYARAFKRNIPKEVFTLRKRTSKKEKLRKEKEKLAGAASEGADAAADELDDGDASDDEEDDDGDLFERLHGIFKKIKNDLADAFAAVLLDEAHTIRNPNGVITRAVLALDGHRYTERPKDLAPATFFVIITGTILYNKAADLGRLMTLFYDETWPDPGQLDLDEYAEIGEEVVKIGEQVRTAEKWPELDLMPFVKVLHPPSYKKHAQPGAGKHMDPVAASIIIPAILRVVQLRRITSDEHEDKDGKVSLIGKSLVLYSSISVELVMSVAQAKVHHPRYLSIMKENIGVGPSKKNPDEPMVNAGVLRRLRHISLTPYLEDAISRTSLNSADVAKVHHEFGDNGATLFQMTTDANDFPSLFTTRDVMARYMGLPSPKWCFLAGLLQYVCGELDEKVLIFGASPPSVMFTHAFITNLGWRASMMKSQHLPATRERICRDFNDPESPTKALVMSLAIGGTSWNLQDACRFVVFVDIPTSTNLQQQALCRCWRLGQTKPVISISLSVDHTSDQRFESKMASKAMAQIAGALGGSDQEMDNDASSEVIEAMAKRADTEGLSDLEARAAEVYRRLMGQRISKAAHIYTIQNPYTKDKLVEESKYRRNWARSRKINMGKISWKNNDELDLKEPPRDMQLHRAYESGFVGRWAPKESEAEEDQPQVDDEGNVVEADAAGDHFFTEPRDSKKRKRTDPQTPSSSKTRKTDTRASSQVYKSDERIFDSDESNEDDKDEQVEHPSDNDSTPQRSSEVDMAEGSPKDPDDEENPADGPQEPPQDPAPENEGESGGKVKDSEEETVAPSEPVEGVSGET